jgi:two-component system sensor histidine kinase BaeS
MASSDAGVADGAAVRTFGDPDRLRQAFGNLIRNALAATPRGGSVMVTTRADDDGIVIEVADTGQGIAPEDLPHIFDRFWRADHSRARASGGAGLGLAIVRQIVADHHGSIAVESAVGVGTTVTLRLESSVG